MSFVTFAFPAFQLVLLIGAVTSAQNISVPILFFGATTFAQKIFSDHIKVKQCFWNYVKFITDDSNAIHTMITTR